MQYWNYSVVDDSKVGSSRSKKSDHDESPFVFHVFIENDGSITTLNLSEAKAVEIRDALTKMLEGPVA